MQAVISDFSKGLLPWLGVWGDEGTDRVKSGFQMGELEP